VAGLYLSRVAQDLAREAAAERILGLLNSGHLSLYAGEPPGPGDTVQNAQPLADLRFAAQAFGPAPAGKALANQIIPSTATASGRATWFRCWGADGTFVMRGLAGEPSQNGDPQPDLVLNSADVRVGATVSIAAFGYSQAG
jgi:hypothetical protein